MGKKLSNLPLTYVVAQVKISPVDSIEKFVPTLQEEIRQDFPIKDNIVIQNIQIPTGSNEAN